MEVTGKIVDAISKEPIPFTSVLPINDKGNVVEQGLDFDDAKLLPSSLELESLI